MYISMGVENKTKKKETEEKNSRTFDSETLYFDDEYHVAYFYRRTRLSIVVIRARDDAYPTQMVYNFCFPSSS